MIAFRSLCSLLLLVCLTSCFDLYTRETDVYGPYYVASDPSASYKSLFYRGKDGLDLDRFQNVSKVGYKAGYIFIKSGSRFYWFAVQNDLPADLGDPVVRQLISKPLSETEFHQLLVTLGIKNLDFQFQE
jgi:hypothetical protein